MRVIYLIRDGHEIRASIPYVLKDVCKFVPGRRWDDDSKHWVFPASQMGNVHDLLAREGVFVEVVYVDPPPRPREKATVKDWATALFREVGCEKATWVFRRLSQSLHPDLGGDT